MRSRAAPTSRAAPDGPRSRSTSGRATSQFAGSRRSSRATVSVMRLPSREGVARRNASSRGPSGPDVYSAMSWTGPVPTSGNRESATPASAVALTYTVVSPSRVSRAPTPNAAPAPPPAKSAAPSAPRPREAPRRAATSAPPSTDAHAGGYRRSSTLAGSSARKRSAAAPSRSVQPRAVGTLTPMPAPAPPGAGGGRGETPPPRPPLKPTRPPSVSVAATVPSDCGVTVSVPRRPRSTLKNDTLASAPSVRERSGHGARPSARASRVEQTSEATTQMPSRMASATLRGMSGAPAAGPATSRIAATRAMTATYSSEAWPAADVRGRRPTPSIGRRRESSPPGVRGPDALAASGHRRVGGRRHAHAPAHARRGAGDRPLEQRLQRGAGVARDVQQRRRIDPEEHRRQRAHHRHHDALRL